MLTEPVLTIDVKCYDISTLLQQSFAKLLDVPLHFHHIVQMEKGGCPARYARPVQTFLNEIYPHKIRWGGPIKQGSVALQICSHIPPY